MDAPSWVILRREVTLGLTMMKRYISKRYFQFSSKKAKFSSTSTARNYLCGRDLLQPTDFSADEWKRILWYAFDLKRATLDKSSLNILSNKHVTLLFLKQSGRNLLSCSLACQLLGAKSTIYANPEFESQPNCVDSGRALSQITDLILVNGCNQAILSQLAEGSCAPVIGLNTNMFSIIGPLAFLMTMQERYGHLKRLKVAWVGPSNPICNTILSIYPSLGIHMKICCICAHGTGLMTPVLLDNALVACSKGLAELHQHSTTAETVYRAHVIITTSHPEEKYQVTIQYVEEAEFEWIFLHPLPRTKNEVSDDVFQHKNNLSWISCSNQLYVSMALIASSLTDYQPLTSMPQFEGPL